MPLPTQNIILFLKLRSLLKLNTFGLSLVIKKIQPKTDLGFLAKEVEFWLWLRIWPNYLTSCCALYIKATTASNINFLCTDVWPPSN